MVLEFLTERACYMKRKEVRRREDSGLYIRRLGKQTGALRCVFKVTVSMRPGRVHCEVKGPVWCLHIPSRSSSPGQLLTNSKTQLLTVKLSPRVLKSWVK